MRTDSRLSRMLHVLLHMARHDEPFTSDQIAKMLTTNAVFVRRTMAGLREAGFVRSSKGRGGGWTLICDLKTTTLLDVYRAVGEPRLLAIGFGQDTPDCAVEKVVGHALSDTFQQAENLITDRLARVALADLLDDFDALCRANGWPKGRAPSDTEFD